MHHIRDCLPELKTQINGMMNEVVRELEALGKESSYDDGGCSSGGGGHDGDEERFLSTHQSCSPQSRLNPLLPPHTTGDPTDSLNRATLGGTMLTLLSRFASNFQSTVEGKGFTRNGVEMSELCGGARIHYIFSEIFGKSLLMIDPFESLTDEEIRTAICNANGTRPALFVPEISFDLLVKRQISRLEQPGLQCVDLVFDELLR